MGDGEEWGRGRRGVERRGGTGRDDALTRIATGRDWPAVERCGQNSVGFWGGPTLRPPRLRVRWDRVRLRGGARGGAESAEARGSGELREGMAAGGVGRRGLKSRATTED